mmetsp:Transcript_17097/g.47713  ORF Transcript_17097/g.47713 Transcript_17097/m.47713 type:complete len:245 (-) Transcript_17097:322-1056(-)
MVLSSFSISALSSASSMRIWTVRSSWTEYSLLVAANMASGTKFPCNCSLPPFSSTAWPLFSTSRMSLTLPSVEGRDSAASAFSKTSFSSACRDISADIPAVAAFLVPAAARTLAHACTSCPSSRSTSACAACASCRTWAAIRPACNLAFQSAPAVAKANAWSADSALLRRETALADASSRPPRVDASVSSAALSSASARCTQPSNQGMLSAATSLELWPPFSAVLAAAESSAEADNGVLRYLGG